ncbi:chemotaxis protein MotB [Cohaesibacter sp. ES.047]|uniref:MotB family protein n=1 Tax=Cohaesibacter sp. ES.047 TaxID=1798205 RepID=UPI000BB75F3D|nr:MotB family protein [Cohaesibacter sp. ES.047]SNY92154.1 chemotaxis protein MotB [Cohaesibacter sp. ES.047]
MNEITKQGEHELIIVRRRPDMDLDNAKTGVWKIAHADFMTAMMAFFLVMWLISTTDDAAKREIAQYFNPVKLAEMSQYQKGIADPEPKAGSAEADAASQAVKKGSAHVTENISSDVRKFGEAGNRTFEEGAITAEAIPTYTEAEIFSDPYGVLNRIMMSAEASGQFDAQQSDESAGTESRIGTKGGEALRDPFDPLYWRLEPNQPTDGALVADMQQPQQPRMDPQLGEANELDGLITGPDPVSDISMGPASGTRMASLTEGVEPTPALSVKADQAKQKDSKGDGSSLSAIASKTGSTVAMTGGPEAKKAALAQEQTKGAEKTETSPSALLEDYRAALKSELNKAPKLDIGKELSVRDKGDGLLIDVTDSPSWGMFAVGSSEPSARSIALLEKIAHSLSGIKGKIIIRGHTDGRPFRAKDYDNWRLSTARAHMARFMLVRGGFDEKRLLRVEGYADQQLKHPDKPEADDNRRIEILVQPTAGATE